MKTMTCREMGGMCDETMSAGTAEEMIESGMKHLKKKHPEMAANIEAMPKDDPQMVAWYEKFMKDWAAAPETK